jgi:hypothetical protein
MKKFSSGCCFSICSKPVITLLVIVLFNVALSCTSALYIPAAGQETATASLAELQAGRKLYVQKCGGCHTLFLPEKYTKQEWQLWVSEMAPKVAMDSAEKDQVLKYLTKGN